MARKYGLITMFILGVVFSLAIITNLSLTQKGTDIYTKRFHFLGVFNLQMIPDEETINKAIEKADTILIVCPADTIDMHAYCVLQEVEIIEVIKGNELIGEKIWISTTNGIYMDNNWGISNLMYSDYKYLVLLNKLDGSYYNDFYMGAIRLDDKKTWELIDISKEYTYIELKEMKYFAEDVETLEKLYEREQYLIQKLKLYRTARKEWDNQ